MTPNNKRPQALQGTTTEVSTHCGKLYLTVNHDEAGRIIEVFARFGKAGGCGSAIMDGITRITSYALRDGLPVERVIKAFAGIGCHHGPNTCINAVAAVLRELSLTPAAE